ncbi:hypothetical protein SLEP1_g17444 [Rubroshorea leprosula]|uniref:Uncharacterized protein n=1 Tax=Rubroshorea leprosula TaxID=152421 RepID=A0AAV5J069_9ROSI|nr:hypothetical protein SLEP1_g17444 [Rubroshorea leprosula]
MNENTFRSGFLAEPSVILQPDLAQEENRESLVLVLVLVLVEKKRRVGVLVYGKERKK